MAVLVAPVGLHIIWTGTVEFILYNIWRVLHDEASATGPRVLFGDLQ